MMIWKVIGVLVVFVLFVFGFAFVFNNLPKEPVELKANYLQPETLKIVEYGTVPVFSEKLRFANNLISYNIEEGCDEDRKNDMVDALSIFSDKVEGVSFYEDREGADIKIECSDKFVKLSESLFAAGEGGPSRIINTSGFKVIEEGSILLYKSESCDYPIVALHELGHVFGFDHSANPSNIMYNVSRCDQRMSDDMVKLMQDLYSIEALADLRIDDASVVIKGRYLDFNVSVLNEGLSDVDAVDLGVFIDGEWVDNVEIGQIEIGYGRTLRVENMRVPRMYEKIEFVVDVDDLVRELNEDNNVVEFVI